MPAVPARLVDGLQFSLADFERLFDADPNLKHAELIDGTVYLRHDGRADAASDRMALIGLLGIYAADTRPVRGSASAHVALDDRNELQPDALLIIKRAAGGMTVTDADGVIRSAVELAADVITSTNATILPKRIAAHEQFGTREYLVWYAEHDCIDWLVRRRGEFVALQPDPADGLLKSEVFPGLWLDPAAGHRRDHSAVLKVVQRGLASPEHAAFVAQLAARRQTP